MPSFLGLDQDWIRQVEFMVVEHPSYLRQKFSPEERAEDSDWKEEFSLLG